MVADKEFNDGIGKQGNANDLLDMPLIIPTNRLDADQYSADDLDGVTESVFGSGNLAYASLQASQTDALLSSAVMESRLDGYIPGTHADRPDSVFLQGFANDSGGSFSGHATPSASEQKLSAHAGSTQSSGFAPSLSEGFLTENNTAFNRGPVSSFSSNNGINTAEDSSVGDTVNNTQEISNTTTHNDNTQVTNVVDNSTHLTVIEAQEVVNLIEQIFNDLGDTITYIDTFLCDAVDILIQQVCNTLEVVFNLLGGNGNGDGDIGLDTDISLAALNAPLDALTDLDVSAVLNSLNVEETLGNIVAPVQDILDDLGLGAVDLAGVTDTVAAIASPVLDVVENIVDSVLGPVLESVVAPVLSPVLEMVDTALLEGVLGQVDDLLDISNNVLLDPVEDLVGDLDLDLGLGLDLLGGSGAETSNSAGDTDIVIQTQIDLIDNTLGIANIDIALDPIEAITGDIDIDLGLALNLLGEVAAPIVNADAGGTGEDTALANLGNTLADVAGEIVTPVLGDMPPLIVEGSVGDDLIGDLLGTIESNLDGAMEWTENLIGSDVPLFGDLAGGGGDLLADILPDPIGTIAEGIGALNIVPNLDIGGLGGLFG